MSKTGRFFLSNKVESRSFGRVDHVTGRCFFRSFLCRRNLSSFIFVLVVRRFFYWVDHLVESTISSVDVFSIFFVEQIREISCFRSLCILFLLMLFWVKIILSKRHLLQIQIVQIIFWGNWGKLATSVCRQMAAWVPDIFVTFNFYSVKNHKIDYNSTTTEARENI